MDNEHLQERFSRLSTPAIADACVKLELPMRAAPPGIRPVIPGTRLAGRALPVRHHGSVDIFLEALEMSETGDVLVIDNGGRTDEACIGDLTALETRAAGVAGLVTWGFHRDTAELVAIGFPVFSYGTCSAGPLRVDPREQDAMTKARFGDVVVGRDDVLFADDNGVLFVTGASATDILGAAETVWRTERDQARAIAEGRTLREQLRFLDYLQQREKDPSYTFRRHLRKIGGAIEE